MARFVLNGISYGTYNPIARNPQSTVALSSPDLMPPTEKFATACEFGHNYVKITFRRSEGGTQLKIAGIRPPGWNEDGTTPQPLLIEMTAKRWKGLLLLSFVSGILGLILVSWQIWADVYQPLLANGFNLSTSAIASFGDIFAGSWRSRPCIGDDVGCSWCLRQIYGLVASRLTDRHSFFASTYENTTR